MATLDLWVRETHRNEIAFSVRVKGYLWSGKSAFQKLDIIDTEAFGRVLLLDGLFMTTEKDEFIYHEMIAHTPLLTHPNPRRVLVIGGGDGGTAREAAKHPSVETVDLVEIDPLVVEKSREFLPSLARGLDHPKTRVHCEDGIEWVKSQSGLYDAIIVDSTDPIGPAVGLFSQEFYADCSRALTEEGVLSAQTESPFFNKQDVKTIHENLRPSFPQVYTYTAAIPTYPGGYWSFALASKGPSPLRGPPETRYSAIGDDLQYYNPDVHRAAFALPNYLKRLLNP